MVEEGRMITTKAGGAAPIATKGLVLRRAQARWYDALAAVLTLGRDRALRERLAGLARLAPGEVVLDVGCGTGSLALAAKRRVGAEGTVVGVDASPEMIDLAARKAARERADVRFETAAAERLPFPEATFDAVLATLMLHHLPAPVRRECAREALRVLKPGGRMLAVDFSRPSPRKGGLLARLHRHGGVSVDKMVALLRDAGFRIVETGSVGVSDLQYVLATSPVEGAEPDESMPVSRSLDPLPRPRWVLLVVGAVLVAGHAAMLRGLSSRLALSTLAVAGAVALVVVLHAGVAGVGRGRARREPTDDAH
jgi:ubiquinone/menaquinone biosynthesis C-methylase UbiE